MDTLHRPTDDECAAVLTRRDHLSVFREFLDHLERMSQRRAAEHARPANGKNVRPR